MGFRRLSMSAHCALQGALASPGRSEACQLPCVETAVSAAQGFCGVINMVIDLVEMGPAVSPGARRVLWVQDDSIRPDIAVHHRFAMQGCQRALPIFKEGSLCVHDEEQQPRTQRKKGSSYSSRARHR